VDAPHIRQRLYWVATDLADAGHMRRGDRTQSSEQKLSPPSGLGSTTVALDDSAGKGLERHGQSGRVAEGGVRKTGIVVGGEGCGPVHMADAPVSGRRQGVADAEGVREGDSSQGPSGRSAQHNSASFWSDHIWLTGSDGKARRAQSGLPLLAHGVSNRVGRLRAYGNAIVPPLAAEVIRAFMECEQ
jgi:DNA (cytosine-5)-methyltransferase 1